VGFLERDRPKNRHCARRHNKSGVTECGFSGCSESTRLNVDSLNHKRLNVDTVNPCENYFKMIYSLFQPELLKTLSDILAHGSHSSVARRQSGLQLKNRLTSNDDAVKANYQERWMAIPDDVRNYIKLNILGALGAEGYRPSAAAQCVQCVAVVELPHGLWPDLLHVLVGNVTNTNSTEMIKEATLEAIGYICQDIQDHRCLEAKSNEILTAIVHGMKREEPSPHVRLAATNALLNSLEFTRANFEKEVNKHYKIDNLERKKIMFFFKYFYFYFLFFN
jgi:importin subunit beta-1